MRSGGELTYFGSDIANHERKLQGGYDRVIDVLGADHHGYLDRLRAAWQALGGDRDAIEFLTMQLVNLTEGGARVQMSKREGAVVSLDELIDDIGVDAARYFLLQRSHDTTLDLDLELARRNTQDNPVYYLQYAHARIASILRKAGREEAGEAHVDGELHPSEQALVKKLLEFPGEVFEAAERRAPHRIAAYLHETSQDFSAFYRDCKVIGDPSEDFRIGLCVMTKRVLARGLDLLGVEAPAQM
jgi:arginyl-tRNA synthetase